MSIESVLREAGLSPWVDARASHRPSQAPKRLTVVSVGGADDTQEAIASAVALETVPIVLVMSSGGVLVLSQGGYGAVAVQGDVSAMTEEQSKTLAIVSDALASAYGLDAPEAPKKKSRKKAAEEIVVEVVADSLSDEVLEVVEEAEGA
jgi:hypothetical protein